MSTTTTAEGAARGASAAMTCSHCGLDAEPGEARHLDGAVYCCAGCETAASIIRQSGLGGFYALPDRVTNRVSVSGRSFAEFDHDAFQAAAMTSAPAAALPAADEVATKA